MSAAKATHINGPADLLISNIAFDSRKVNDNTLFIALKGTKSDGHAFINQAVTSGATAILCQDKPESFIEGISYYISSDTNAALAYTSNSWFGFPSAKLKLIGVTGTNGKTTTATLLSELFTSLGYKTGLLSTVENRIGNERIAATHTTPDALALNALLDQMVEAGCEYAFMEVSSHSVVQHRITGLTFAGAIFSNLTHDHLDYHKTFAEYLKAKKGFFDMLGKEAFALINEDDKNGRVMVQNTRAQVYGYALKQLTDFHCKVIESRIDGQLLRMNDKEAWFRLVGEFNAYNLTAIWAAATLLGIDSAEVLIKLSELPAVEGRFETIRSNDGKTAIIDYAHTPDALENVLKTINSVILPEIRVITVVGAGGDRDKTKRPIMARIAAQMSNQVILTSDNPRSEKPEDILNDMRQGLSKDNTNCLTITSRQEAIAAACQMARAGDVILIAGKGHEKYQEIMGVKHPFDDKEEVRKAFKL